MKPHHAMTRTFLKVLACLSALGAATTAIAQSDASKETLRIVVPFGPGTPLDVIARDIAQEIRPLLQQTIVVENKPGAAGMIGGAEVARTTAPATTFMLTTHNTVVINPHLYKNMTYQPQRDFTPVGLVGVGGYVLVAAPTAPFKTLDQYLAEAKVHPGKVSYGSLGIGSGPHMCGEMLVEKTKVRLLHVPFTTGSIVNVVSGQVDSSWEPYATAAPFIRTGKLVALGASTNYRASVFPSTVPLLPESLPGYECTSWIGLFASVKAPDATVRRLSDALTKVVQSPGFQERLISNGFLPKWASPSEMRDLIANDSKTWERIVSATGLKLD
ncbi:Bug family tripartite tricarboxylate transporter substrate binding protein [Hydrogenophaga sp. OTU3427]|uniref:Bug family tripartite tricarboxylate transporter substrate binding protein n=1 Tax=Hydrogenophaga sp. OTU3427 TaxID=3043856 RepID=UPI00313C0660